MFILPKMLCLGRANCRSQARIIIAASKLQTFYRKIHFSVNLSMKMYLENENKYAYSIMESKGYTASSNIEPSCSIITNEQFQQLVKEDWSKQQPKRLFEVFSMLGTYCTDRKLCISNPMFDSFIDNLTDNIKHASDEELKVLILSLLQWPETDSIRTRNYIEVWAALDDECLKRQRTGRWNYDEILCFVSLFFKLNILKHSDFTNKVIQKLTSKAKQLSPEQLVQTMFFIGVLRRQPLAIHNLELQAINCFEDLSVDDLAVMSMGFFKSKTPIRSMEFVDKIINQIIENKKDIHEVSLAALLKVIRYSAKIVTDNRIYRLLDALQHEVPRLSVMCTVHLALLGTSTLTLHEDCLTQIATRMANSLEQSRLKDLERLILTYGTFNFKPKINGDLFEKMLDELRKPERQLEIEKYPKTFACCVNYFFLLEFYPVDLMNKALSPEFLKNAYGKNCYQYGRETLSIHNTSLIFCNDTQMHRLTDKEAKVLAKKYTSYVPDESYRKQYNITEKMMLDVLQVLRDTRGGDEFVVGDHILTHHQRGDIIMCSRKDGLPLPVDDKINLKNFGLLRKLPDNNNWTVLVIAGRNALIQGSYTPSGIFQHKVKELKALGYHAALVPWTIYNDLKTKEEKSTYLNNLIKSAID